MKGKFFSIFIAVLFCASYNGKSQMISVYGPTTVVPGSTENYDASLAFSPHPYELFTWYVIGGTIINQNSNPSWGPLFCTVEWSSSTGTGFVQLTSEFNGSGDISVVIGTTLDPGGISAIYPYYNYLHPTPDISQIPAGSTSCSALNYTWESSSDNIYWSPIGTGEDYPSTAPPLASQTYIRRAVECGGYVVYSNVLLFSYQSTNWENRNFIRTNVLLYPGKHTFEEADNLPIGQKHQSTVFYDGLGRPEQNVSMGFSPQLKDIVTPIEYDALGRETKKHLAYQAVDGLGKFRPNALPEQQDFMGNSSSGKYKDETVFYSETKLEASPLAREMKILAPGSNWGGSNVGISTDYELNTQAGDAVRIWTIAPNLMTDVPQTSNVYADKMLFKIISKDERGKQQIEYKDKEGKTILKKLQFENSAPELTAAHGGWLCTYYVYDDYGRMRFVISPKAVDKMNASGNWTLTPDIENGLCFKYIYDGKGRVISKKVPDAEPVFMVYDHRDRLVFTQDGNQRSGPIHEWRYFLYDALNRQIATGLLKENVHYSLSALQDQVTNYGMVGEQNVVVQTENSEWLTVHNPIPIFPTLGYTINFISTEIHTVNYYDQNNSGDYQNVTLGYPGNFENIESGAPSKRNRGMLTASKVKVLDGASNTYILNTSIYDEKGRVIQTSSSKYENKSAVVTNQYDFAGNIRSSVHQDIERISGPFVFPKNELSITSKYEFDHANRLLRIKKNFTSDVFGEYMTTGERTVTENTYDELGQLSKKTLAPGYAGPNGSFLEELKYDYNIRGWLKGINKDYAKSPVRTGAFFGMELGYDKPGDAGFANTILNGNIGGIAWKTAGDNTSRKYDFLYDNTNRIAVADFNQKNDPASTTWEKNKMDFSMPLIQYDFNGNIKRKVQKGVNFAGIVNMDKMTYGVGETSNKLEWVAEDDGAVEHKLGDFADLNPGIGVTDYTYDANGNLKNDLNKGISQITYNYMNLPELVTIPGKGTVQYIYDASGGKLKKIITDNTPSTGAVTKTTQYRGPITLEHDGTFFSFEEGRVRQTSSASCSPIVGLTFDYFIKDHLGNIRMILTEENTCNTYPKATMETASAANEDKYYVISNRTDKPAELLGNPPSLQTDIDNRYQEKMSKLSTLGASKRVGPSILLKVMSGDVVHAKTDYYYKEDGTQINSTSLLNDLVTSLMLHLTAGHAGNTAKAQASLIGTTASGSSVIVGTSGLINQQNNSYNSTKPKAFINYIVFDEQFNAKAQGFKQVINPGPLQPELFLNDIEIENNGWLYVFVNNESEQAVYFDNFQVNHTRGNILEETHYYPFGLAMKAISSRALSINPTNKNKFNGKELQSDEFSDGSGLEWHNYGVRLYDQQIGRWNQIDPLAEKMNRWSPFNYAFNNPVKFVDPNGSEPQDWILMGKRPIWDVRVVDQKTASALYGPNAMYLGSSYSYGAKDGRTVHLWGDGSWNYASNTGFALFDNFADWWNSTKFVSKTNIRMTAGLQAGVGFNTNVEGVPIGVNVEGGVNQVRLFDLKLEPLAGAEKKNPITFEGGIEKDQTRYEYIGRDFLNTNITLGKAMLGKSYEKEFFYEGGFKRTGVKSYYNENFWGVSNGSVDINGNINRQFIGLDFGGSASLILGININMVIGFERK